MSEFTEGQRVLLKANAEEGWPEEVGTVEGAEPGYPEMFVVRVDGAYREADDDGLREVTVDQMAALA